jgi:hypothetical protein
MTENPDGTLSLNPLEAAVALIMTLENQGATFSPADDGFTVRDLGACDLAESELIPIIAAMSADIRRVLAARTVVH